ncbi:CynX/NimT family MFS transporter [Cellulomonas sp. HZM]|uniref:MFS transporter n=1 Tax=Cellulomonas sp. HZM TaxID=1454010 RepID=UPI000B18655E|nr:MFS transporter [Cellulomonas sp. HZM]
MNAAAPAPWRGRLVVLAGIVLVGLNLRIAVAAVSPIVDVVRQDVDLTATEVGLLGTIPVISFALFGSLATPLARRFGLEPTMVAALLLSAGGEVARALVSSPPAFLGWSMIALAGMGMGNVLLPPLVKRYFPDRIGAVTASYSVALSVSTAVPPLFALPLAQATSWRVAIGVWAVVGLAAVVPWAIVIVRSASARAHLGAILRRAPQPTGPGALGHTDGTEVRTVWRSRQAWAMAVMFGMNSLGTYVGFAWIPQLLADAGLPADEGGRWLALFAVLGAPMSLFGPVLAQRLRNPYPVVVAFVTCWAIGYVGLLTTPAHGTAVWMVLLGIGPSSFPVLLALLGLRSTTPATAIALSGMVQGTGYVIAGVGPVGIGALYEATGGWDAPIVVLLGCLVVLLTAAWFACRPTMIGPETVVVDTAGTASAPR